MIGEVRAASFLGAEEEYVLDLDGVELRSIQAPIGAQAGDMVEVTIRPENCTVFVEDGWGAQITVTPPSTISVWPVTAAAPSLAR